MYSVSEIEHLIARFELSKLPRSEWTHEAHLVVAIWYTLIHAEEKALVLVRELITKHNASVGTPNTDSEGYHETITKFWLQLAGHFLNANPGLSIEELCNRFIDSKSGQSNYLLHYYSAELLFSVHARKMWVEPDLRQLEISDF